MSRHADRAERLRFRSLPATLTGVTAAAVRLKIDGVEKWTPLSTLCLASARRIAAAQLGEEISVRVEEWKADALGWTGRPQQQERLL